MKWFHFALNVFFIFGIYLYQFIVQPEVISLLSGYVLNVILEPTIFFLIIGCVWFSNWSRRYSIEVLDEVCFCIAHLNFFSPMIQFLMNTSNRDLPSRMLPFKTIVRTLKVYKSYLPETLKVQWINNSEEDTEEAAEEEDDESEDVTKEEDCSPTRSSLKNYAFGTPTKNTSTDTSETSSEDSSEEEEEEKQEPKPTKKSVNFDDETSNVSMPSSVSTPSKVRKKKKKKVRSRRRRRKKSIFHVLGMLKDDAGSSRSSDDGGSSSNSSCSSVHEIEEVVTEKNASLAILHFVGLNRCGSKIVENLVKYVEKIEEVVKKFGGCVVEWNGFEVIIGFNCVKPVPTHYTRACKFVVEVISVCEKLHKVVKNNEMKLRVGVVTGNGWFGHFGTANTKRYHICGKIMKDLQQMRTELTNFKNDELFDNFGVLCNDKCYEFCKFGFVFFPVKMIQVEKKNVLIYGLEREKEKKVSDEWMYEIEDCLGDDKKIIKGWNLLKASVGNPSEKKRIEELEKLVGTMKKKKMEKKKKKKGEFVLRQFLKYCKKYGIIVEENKNESLALAQ